MSKIVEEIHNIHYQCFYQGCNFKITNDHERFDKHLAKHISSNSSFNRLENFKFDTHIEFNKTDSSEFELEFRDEFAE